MKKILLAMFFSSLIVLAIPLIIVMLMNGIADNSPKDDELISVYFHEDDTVKQINAAEYLIGVVAAEMPAAFEEEALKAQAAAARTYMRYHSQKASEHKGGAAVCTDYRHCQAWTDINDKMEAWGDDAEKYRRKIENAVYDTADEIITYNGSIINSVFFSTSSGKTENAEDVWGEAVPYLISVDSPGEENAPKFSSEISISADDAKKKISENTDGADFSEKIFSDIVRSDAGGIKNISAGGIRISGPALREIFDLNSTNAEITENGGSVTFRVKGNGHGVGMSQYGAEAMAENGAGYKEILTHYYTGCEITNQPSPSA